MTSDSRMRNQQNRYVHSSNSYSNKKRQSTRSKKRHELIYFYGDEFQYEREFDYENEDIDWEDVSNYIDAQWKEICDVIDLNDSELLECLLPPTNVFNSKEIYWTNELSAKEYKPFINILSHAIRIGHSYCVGVILDKIYTGELETDLLHKFYNIEHVPLWYACKFSDLNLVQELVEYAHVNINQYDFLRLAVLQNDVLLVDYLLSQGYDIQSHLYEDILHRAVDRGYFHIVKTLLKYGVDPNPQDDVDKTPLDYAIHHKDVDMIKVLLEHKHGHLQPNYDKFTPMMLAAHHNSRYIVDLLFRLLPFDQCIDDLVRLACRYTVDLEIHDQEMAFYFFSQGLNKKQLSDDFPLYEVYEFRRECQTLEELESIRNDSHLMQLHALLVNERMYLEHGDTNLYLNIIEKQCEPYIGRNSVHQRFHLRLHAYQLILRIQKDEYDFKRLFDEETNDELCQDFFQIWENDGFVSIDSLVTVANWMFFSNLSFTSLQIKIVKIIICILQSKKLTKNQQITLINIVKRLETEHKSYFLGCFMAKIVEGSSIEQSGQSSFSIFSAILFLIHCGTDVNGIFHSWTGDRPLHLIARCSDIIEAKLIIELLLNCGAHPDAINYFGNQPKNEAKVRSVKKLLSTSRHLSLKCRCAQVIISQKINYKHYFNRRTIDFIQLHDCKTDDDKVVR
ncbi:unnamed protein product [Adineta ricciae]|uniref:Uncharacterized protein n=1 Tax=Adineta ricciae TaxID=249248 RepID=A0A814IRN4_ADIRI|nr:unnamed protein product [Adineta ricciae]CAF1460301.1 unnamed protein product [Adineta ricciae]